MTDTKLKAGDLVMIKRSTTISGNWDIPHGVPLLVYKTANNFRSVCVMETTGKKSWTFASWLEKVEQ